MNIDKYLIQGFRYFKHDVKLGLYYTKENVTRNDDTGVISGSNGVAVEILLQSYEQEQISDVISDNDSLCLLHCSIPINIGEEDIIKSEGYDYEVTKIYKNISKKLKIVNVRKY